MSAQNTESPTARFTVTAQAGPGVLPRLLDYYAKRGLVPDRFDAVCDGPRLTVEIEKKDMELELARYIGRCLDRIFEVERVLVTQKRFADVA